MAFRGNQHPLPYNTEIGSSDTPELIEITAPGHEGRRFWIKLDRPRSLMVSLPTGSGEVDATYEETSAALGDAVIKPAIDNSAPVALNSAHGRRCRPAREREANCGRCHRAQDHDRHGSARRHDGACDHHGAYRRGGDCSHAATGCRRTRHSSGHRRCEGGARHRQSSLFAGVDLLRARTDGQAGSRGSRRRLGKHRTRRGSERGLRHEQHRPECPIRNVPSRRVPLVDVSRTCGWGCRQRRVHVRVRLIVRHLARGDVSSSFRSPT